MPRRYSPEQREWLLGHFADMTNAELAEAFSAEFGTEVTSEQMRTYGKNHRLRKTDDAISRSVSRGKGGPSAEELEFLRGFVPGHGGREIREEFARRFGREITRGMLGHAKARLGVRCGVNAGRFEKGHEAWSKGKTWDEMGYTPEQQERMRANHFKPGERNEYTEARMRALLDTKDGPDGCLMICVAPRDATYPAARWISYARFVWMQANGRDWPEGHRAVFADHDNRNFDPANIVPVPVDLSIIIQGNAHGRALPYHDRESLEVAINHARVIRARYAAEQRLRSASRPPARW